MLGTKKTIFIAWFFLILAIVAEVIGTSFLKMSEAWGEFLALGIMAFFIAVSYFFMGLAIKKIQVGIAYAVWELLGVILILAVSFVIFHERLSNTQILGIFLALVGIVMINFGEKKE
ncbi:QacE family quaternary ammonium compound efflux SMR transporter [Campylobacter sp. MIT 99-7217]|uniref:DMT family transporter n=1 Tax=Campylobacter sp. MIT 99-7217 TaxID=535091 RepID=UPI00115B55AD|nr:multidrug efflux SMR transporter [Campylobacter sp. MIT 99-7217]TQR34650.1 QacE family quaternary ammonium compound efflux SMR transporter [Campylobacter sp. MIT 99-7217]